MFETLNRLWNEGKLSEPKLDLAVSKGWITTAEKETIINEAAQ